MDSLAEIEGCTHFQVGRSITLFRNAQDSWATDVNGITCVRKQDQVIECRMDFQATPDLYQQIDREALFNLKPELRGAMGGGAFLPDADVEIVVTLKPDFLAELAPHAETAEAAANYLLALSQTTPEHPLLQTENWLALSVTQQQETGEVGFTTLWHTLNPAALAAGTLSEADITPALTRFFADWTEANLGSVVEDTTSQLLEELGNVFTEAVDRGLEDIADAVTPEPLLTTLIQFFTEDDWSFTKLQGESALRTACQGEKGQWNCYAKVREAAQQVVFYSVCSLQAAPEQRLAVAEFITRANYGLIIGNFEMDWSDGEIRYKTSIDVEGDRLTPALIKRLVYANVMMMDTYFPGIQAILETGVEPEAAIDLVEPPVTNPV
ncbi:YbjN domain-containing protein [Leptolyngbya sp. PCC 6406]|uniref:YbjN domain-containing protein n=1 Tax=Leptolyngbya sp. PCC 6406 TaxID=1173264 RepID=UPI0002E6F21C|nr:YbjN domain-containing protein [Leptolyngbya sp. PCC 6406]